MTRFLKIRCAGVAFGALLVFAVMASAKAEGVPASFDCARAGSTVEKFICSRAVLRWQDLALSHLYRTARNAVGITVFDMATHGEHRIAGTSQGDRPYAISDDFGLFVWSSRTACGDERMVEDEDAPERFCLTTLAKPEGSK